MAMFIRAKRVSDPLDDNAKARLRGDHRYSPITAAGYASSGSEHEADPLFSGPIHAFLQIDESLPDNALVSDDDNNGDAGIDNPNSDYAQVTVRNIIGQSGKSDTFLVRLHADVVQVAETLEGTRQCGENYRRAVMARLRESGYNAGICKARWETSGSLTAGRYEYVDVVVDDKERYIIDLEFATEFEVARATEEYADLLAVLPRVMVGRSEDVRELVRIMAEAARRSLKSKELHVPPWRKRRYMLAKWLGPYRRTVSSLPSMTANAKPVAAAAAAAGEMIKSRVLGFGNGSERILSRAA